MFLEAPCLDSHEGQRTSETPMIVIDNSFPSPKHFDSWNCQNPKHFFFLFSVTFSVFVEFILHRFHLSSACA